MRRRVLEVALAVEVELLCEELAARSVADGDEQARQVEAPSLLGEGVAHHQAGELAVLGLQLGGPRAAPPPCTASIPVSSA